MAKCKTKPRTYARFCPIVKGLIYGMFLAGVGYQDIANSKEVVKTDGSHASQQAVAGVVERWQSEQPGKWDGTAKGQGQGPARATSSSLDRKIVNLVFKYRGRAKVTVDFVRKKIPAARKIGKRTVGRRLEDAGLKWLKRRRKTLVPKQHKQPRIDFSKWVLRRTAATLKRWIYSDGTTFYLARTAAEKESQRRLALGTHVWRMADGSDGMYEDVVGPSSYKKGQGTCIRIWGLLIAGTLFVTVLPEGEAMNRWNYAKVVAKCFPGWIRSAMGRRAKPIMVQDHERALWCDEPRDAMRECGIELLENYPKCSQDLNVIETAWRELRERLYETEPTEMEDREEFIKRLRLAVAWVNRNRRSYLRHLCRAQKERAEEVLDQKGGRTTN